MLRFILKRDGEDVMGRRWQKNETVDLEVPELERLLTRGGYGDGWDQTHLVGVEVLPPEPVEPGCAPAEAPEGGTP